MTRYIVTKEQLKILGLAYKKLGRISVQDDDTLFMRGQQKVDDIFNDTIKIRVPDWATHFASSQEGKNATWADIDDVEEIPT